MASSRMQRWADYLSEYDFMIRHISDIDYVCAVRLSHMPKFHLNIKNFEKEIDKCTCPDYMREGVDVIDSNLIEIETQSWSGSK